MRNFNFAGRSTVHGVNGMAACEHPLAALAAIDMLRRGGTAADGAVAAAAVLAVVEPQATGIGGDAFCLVAPKGSAAIEGYNGSGRAPAGLSLAQFAGQNLARIPIDSVHAVTIPGAVDCWTALLARYGKLSLATVLEPAIAYATDGFAVSPRVAYEWEANTAKLGRNAHTARHWLPTGGAPRAGVRFRHPALARTLSEIARHGREGFYAGWVAEDIVKSLGALGGAHALPDFAAHTGNWVEPVRSTYRGVEVCEIPPGGQGITTLLMLNILENFALKDVAPLSAARFHLEAEATRFAFIERGRSIADPDHSESNTAHFTDKAFAKSIAGQIDPARATGLTPPPMHKSDTTYLAVADKDGTMVSFINSVYHGWGSGIASDQSGVLFHNRGHGFVLDEKHPNALKGGKRPFHTIIPAMALKDGKPWLAFGVMGGDYQPVGQTHVLTNIVDYGMDPQEAVDAPRAFLFNDTLACEESVSVETRAALAAMGHNVSVAPEPLGGSQVVMRDVLSETWSAGSDPRKDGCALGY